MVDAFAQVLRLFHDETIPHERGSLDPLRDLEDVETELILSDLVVVEKRLERLEKDRKKIKSAELDHEFEALQRAKTALDANQPLRQLELDAAEEKRIRGFQFLSQKPMLYVLNLGEDEAGQLREREREYREGALAGRKRTAVAAVCGKIEAELAELSPEEQRDYLASYGLQESGLERLISATYSLLGLMSFLTAGEDEVRAWTIPANSNAVKAAGRHPFGFRKEVHPRRGGELENPGRPGRIRRRARKGPTAPRRERIHRQGRRRAGDPARIAVLRGQATQFPIVLPTRRRSCAAPLLGIA